LTPYLIITNSKHACHEWRGRNLENTKEKLPVIYKEKITRKEKKKLRNKQ